MKVQNEIEVTYVLYVYITIMSIVKLREREGQGVDPGRSLKGHL